MLSDVTPFGPKRTRLGCSALLSPHHRCSCHTRTVRCSGAAWAKVRKRAELNPCRSAAAPKAPVWGGDRPAWPASLRDDTRGGRRKTHPAYTEQVAFVSPQKAPVRTVGRVVVFSLCTLGGWRMAFHPITPSAGPVWVLLSAAFSSRSAVEGLRSRTQVHFEASNEA